MSWILVGGATFCGWAMLRTLGAERERRVRERHVTTPLPSPPPPAPAALPPRFGSKSKKTQSNPRGGKRPER